MKWNENRNTAYQPSWDAANAVLRGEFIAIIWYIKKLAGYQINNLTLHLKDLEKGEKIKCKLTKGWKW